MVNQWVSTLIWAFVGICFFCIVVKIILTKLWWQLENDQDIIETVEIWLLIVFWWMLATFILGITVVQLFVLLFHLMIGV